MQTKTRSRASLRLISRPRPTADAPEVPTLQTAFDEYLACRSSLRPASVKGYKQCFKGDLADWLSYKLDEISREMVLYRHREISQKCSNYGMGEAQADRVMRSLRAVYNFARARWCDSFGNSVVAYNPVDVLSESRSWNQRRAKPCNLRRDLLPEYWTALHRLDNRVITHWMTFCLLTGLRRQESASLRWEYVDFKDRAITIPADVTKNRQEFKFPLSDYALALLQHRRSVALTAWVFERSDGSGKHVSIDSRHNSVITRSIGSPVTNHDLRKMYAQCCLSAGLPELAISRLLNHRTALNGSVTIKHYMNTHEIESLRQPAQLVTDYILNACGVDKSTALAAFEPSQTQEGRKDHD